MDLYEKTRKYWAVSMAYHQRPEGPDLAVGTAINMLQDVNDNINPARPLYHKVYNLQENLIVGINNTQQAVNN